MKKDIFQAIVHTFYVYLQALLEKVLKKGHQGMNTDGDP